MQIVIDIPKHIYEWVTTDKRAYSIMNIGHMVIIDAIKNATPLGEAGKDINAPATDCVSRKEVMQSKPEWLNENVERDTSEQTLIDREYSKGWNKCLQVFLDNIKQLPSVKTATVWHKVEEELPKEHICEDGYVEPSESVLVMLNNGEQEVTRFWGNRRNKNDYHDWLDLSYPTTLKVIAWTELPKWEVEE